jgi:hypothetical protein
MPSYDTAYFDPPAPVAQVMLRNPHSGRRLNHSWWNESRSCFWVW